MDDVRLALELAADTLDIAADWNLNDVQIYPPREWGLSAWDEDEEDGWVSTRELADKLREIRNNFVD